MTMLEQLHNLEYEEKTRPNIDYELLFTPVNTLITARD